MATRHPVQLSEWWADFDEHVMRPVFNKPDALADWTPRSEGGVGLMNAAYVHASATPVKLNRFEKSSYADAQRRQSCCVCQMQCMRTEI